VRGGNPEYPNTEKIKISQKDEVKQGAKRIEVLKEKKNLN